MSKLNKTVAEKTEELTKLIAWFDSDDFELEQAMEKFKEAKLLSADIELSLNSLKNDIDVIKQKFDSEK